jgi:hypothetical protein
MLPSFYVKIISTFFQPDQRLFRHDFLKTRRYFQGSRTTLNFTSNDLQGQDDGHLRFTFLIRARESPS